jgi:hypothetical protein
MVQTQVDPPSKPRPERKPLVIHPFGSSNLLEIDAISRRFVRRLFIKHDSLSKHRIPMCKTTDGIPVFFVGDIYHLLSRDLKQPLRTFETMRAERIHWIVPIIEGRVKSTVHRADGMGEELGDSFRKGERYRVFWVPSCRYQIILKYVSKDTKLNLITAFRVTEPFTRERLDVLFGT